MVSQYIFSIDRSLTFSHYYVLSTPLTYPNTDGGQAQTHANELSPALPLQAVHLPTQSRPSCDTSCLIAGSGSLSKNSTSNAAPIMLAWLAHEQHPERQGRSLGAATPSRPRNRAESRPVTSRSKAFNVDRARLSRMLHTPVLRPFDCSLGAPSIHCSLRLPLTPVFSHDLRFSCNGGAYHIDMAGHAA